MSFLAAGAILGDTARVRTLTFFATSLVLQAGEG